MLRKEKIKLFLYVFLTPIIIIMMIITAIILKDKDMLIRENNGELTQRELLDVINHTHTIQ